LKRRSKGRRKWVHRYIEKKMKGGGVLKLNVTFGKGVAEGWRDEKRDGGTAGVCVFLWW